MAILHAVSTRGTEGIKSRCAQRIQKTQRKSNVETSQTHETRILENKSSSCPILPECTPTSCARVWGAVLIDMLARRTQGDSTGAQQP